MTAARRERRAGLDVLTWPLFDGLGIDVVVTTTAGGVSTGVYESLNLGLHVGDDPQKVVENRRRAAGAVGLGLDDLVFCRQSHGREVAVVDAGDRGRGTTSEDDALADVDALVTAEPDVGLVVMVADCVPIVLFDPAGGLLACVHAGWRGTVARVVDATVDRMVALGADAATIRAGVGPAIPADRYQVGPEVLAAAEQAFPGDVGGLVVPDGTGRWTFDLWAANAVALAECGIDGDRVAVAAEPTGKGAFFSDRAQRPCGRFAAIGRIRA